MSEKIRIRGISLWHENSVQNNRMVSCNTMTEANQTLTKWAWKVESGYVKCSFSIFFDDGLEYRGRIDIENPGKANVVPDLERHVTDYLRYNAGLRCPGGWDRDAYLRRLSETHDILGRNRKEFQDVLDRYDFSGALSAEQGPAPAARQPVPA